MSEYAPIANCSSGRCLSHWSIRTSSVIKSRITISCVIALCREYIPSWDHILLIEVHLCHTTIFVSPVAIITVCFPQTLIKISINRCETSLCSLLCKILGIHKHKTFVCDAQRVRYLIIVVIECS